MKEYFQYIPFLALASSNISVDKTGVDYSRAITRSLEMAVLALILLWGDNKLHKQEIESLNNSRKEMLAVLNENVLLTRTIAERVAVNTRELDTRRSFTESVSVLEAEIENVKQFLERLERYHE